MHVAVCVAVHVAVCARRRKVKDKNARLARLLIQQTRSAQRVLQCMLQCVLAGGRSRIKRRIFLQQAP